MRNSIFKIPFSIWLLFIFFLFFSFPCWTHIHLRTLPYWSWCIEISDVLKRNGHFFFLLESYSSHALKQDEIMVFYHFKLNDAHQVYDHLAFSTYFLIGTKRTYTLARTNSFPTLWYLKTTKFYGNYSIPQSSYYREIIFNETVLFYGFIDSKTCTQSHTSIVYIWKFSCKTHNNTVYVLFGTFDLNLVTH